MTNRLPEWSTNFPLNLPKQARALLGRISVRLKARSVGHGTKRLIGRGIAAACPEAVAEWVGINRRYYHDDMIEGQRPGVGEPEVCADSSAHVFGAAVENENCLSREPRRANQLTKVVQTKSEQHE